LQPLQGEGQGKKVAGKTQAKGDEGMAHAAVGRFVGFGLPLRAVGKGSLVDESNLG
jgi:hypothetical protein